MKKIITFIGLLLASTVSATAQIATGGTYTLNQSVTASGGGTSGDATGTVYKVFGTAGQPAAGTILYGGGYVLKNGFWNSAALAPTAAEVSVSGRVLTSNGKGLTNARVMITNSKGQIWIVQTGSFGNFTSTAQKREKH